MILDATNVLNSPVRSFETRVELYNGSALADAFSAFDALKEFSIERSGEESKFFGYGICQKMNLKLIDKDRNISITTAHSLKNYLGAGGDLINPFPLFYVSRVVRDENTNALSITAYDALYKATEHTVEELVLTAPYTIRDVAEAAATLLNLSGIDAIDITEETNPFDINYADGANLDGTETIREALNAIAEVTQTIYFINSENKIVFKRLSLSSEPVLTISKNDYFTLESGANRRLKTILHSTELGDNLTASIAASGTTQVIKDNPFWDLREDTATLLDNAIAAIGGLTINQFNCKWRGNFLLEIGDKIALVTKDNQTVISYILDDVLTYDGTLSEHTIWKYSSNDEETAANPTSLGDAIKQTYARVDKANKRIDLVASEVNSNSEAISSLQINTDSINASVQDIQTNITDSLNGINESVATLTNKVEAAITSEDVQIQIRSELANGVDKVTTATGFTFNEEGLTVSKTGSEMETQITEDGMVVYKDDVAVLTANNIGVDAVNLHATTYLIIGTNSRFEDYADNRTGCFWIGN